MLRKQQGFVSIIVATILMILLSLITIGFYVLMQREQRQSLDRQLNKQAFYAAETAVNDVNAALTTNPTSLPEEKTDCDVSGWDNGAIDAGEITVSYTCLLFDQTPEDLLFTDVINTASSKIFVIEDENNTPINTITFKWDGPPSASTNPYVYNSNDCASSPIPLPDTASFDFNAVPLLRIDLISVPTSPFSRDYLRTNTAAMYLYPKSCGSNSVAFTSVIGATEMGQVVNVNCSPTDACSFTFTNLAGSTRYYARIKSIYNNVHTLKIEATTTDGSAFEFQGVQTLVDATGKANDVLQRIEARLSTMPDYVLPETVIRATDGVCKTIQYAPPDIVRNSNCY